MGPAISFLPYTADLRLGADRWLSTGDSTGSVHLSEACSWIHSCVRSSLAVESRTATKEARTARPQRSPAAIRKKGQAVLKRSSAAPAAALALLGGGGA
ncbi:hypothetical protein HPB50_019941 [Hyalomma asiaticum]|uniref:Uncharacterized protein n=1 Tax=Hyalomma asiaticum TaxID=266040 RepID=A0ACB7SXB3_HYAAI|nr:hypothetical protein HPB50_019941 [Hyalomma asiaticum]